ncbi:MAG: hypothetical protein ACJA13_001935 [Paraglaciecola sp.]|jgi:hypothetical protein
MSEDTAFLTSWEGSVFYLTNYVLIFVDGYSSPEHV